jgi:hypothetical protein
MVVFNLTPHAIALINNGKTDFIPPSPLPVCRVSSTPGTLTDIGMFVPVATATTFGEIENLPEPLSGCVFIVSGMVASALAQQGVSRPDVLVPGTGPNDGAVRDNSGRIVGVTRLVRATA